MKSKIFSITLILFSITTIADEKISVDKKALMDKLIKHMDQGRTAEYFTEKYTEKYFNYVKNIKLNKSDNIREKINLEISQYFDKEVNQKKSLNKSIYSLIDREFTEKELKEILDFYESDIGKKHLNLMPQIMQDSGLIAQKWGNAQEVEVQRLLKSLFEKENIKPQADTSQ